MRFFTSSLAILLALVAFGPNQTMAKEPSGGQGKGHPGGGQPRAVQPSVAQPNAAQPSIRQPSVVQHGTASTRPQREAGPNPGQTGAARTNGQQAADGQVNRQYSAGVGVQATPDSWRYRSDNGRWWYWTPQNRWMWFGDDGQWMDYRAETYSAPANAYVVQRPIVANFSGSPIRISNPATSGVTLSYTLDGNAYTIPPGYSQDLREDRAWVIEFNRGENLDPARYGLQAGLYTFTSTDHGWELYRSELP
jgi:hypothetical protein